MQTVMVVVTSRGAGYGSCSQRVNEEIDVVLER